MNIQLEKEITNLIDNWSDHLPNSEFVSKASLFRLEYKVKEIIESILNEKEIETNRKVFKR